MGQLSQSNVNVV